MSQWRKGLDKDDLTTEILAKLTEQYPGVAFNFSQYLQDNVAEAVSSVKGGNSIKLFGNDLRILTDTANSIRSQLEKVPGIADLAVYISLGQPTIQIDIDRARAGRYGLSRSSPFRRQGDKHTGQRHDPQQEPHPATRSHAPHTAQARKRHPARQAPQELRPPIRSSAERTPSALGLILAPPAHRAEEKAPNW